MSIYSLVAAVALISVVLAIRVRPSLLYPNGALPVTIVSLFFLAASAAGPSLWDLSAPLVPAGIPVLRPMTADERDTASLVFLLCAAGPLAAAWVTSGLRTARRRSSVSPDVLISPSVKLLLTGLALTVLVLWVIGQGSSAWSSEDYRTPTGPLAVQRLANPLVPLSVLIVGFLGLTSTSHLAPGRMPTLFVRLPWILFASAWWVLLATKGTRSSIIAGAVLGLLLLWPRRRAIAQRWVAAVGSAVIALASVQYVLMSRNFPLGASRFWDMTLGEYGVFPFAPSSLVDSMWFLAKNLSGFVFITAASVVRAPSQDLIITNLNPLPGARAEDTLAGIETYLPWVPLTTAGELYGAFGALAVVLLTSVIAVCLVVAVSGWGQSKIEHFVALVAYACIPLALIWVSQYPTRNAFRIAWILVGVAVVRGIIFMFVRKRGSTHEFNEHGVGLRRHAGKLRSRTIRD